MDMRVSVWPCAAAGAAAGAGAGALIRLSWWTLCENCCFEY